MTLKSASPRPPRRLPRLLLALALSAGLWFYVSSRGGAEMAISVPLEYRNAPPSLVVTDAGVKVVEIQIRGRESALREMQAGRIRASLDLAGAKAGDGVYALDAGAFTIPPNLQVTRINPRTLRVRMESLVRKEVAVLPILGGRPAEGYRVVRIETIPPRVRIEGAQSALESLGKLLTEPVDMAGARATFSREVSLVLSGPGIRVEPRGTVRIKVHITRQN